MESTAFNFAFCLFFKGDNENENEIKYKKNFRLITKQDWRGKKLLRVLEEEIVVLMAGVVAGLERSDRPRPLAWHPPLHWPKLAERSAEVTASSVAARLRVHLCAESHSKFISELN